MTERQPHFLNDYKWRPVVPKGVELIKDHITQPRMLWIGKTIVESPFHELTEFAEPDCTPVEFHRYNGSWKVEGFAKTFLGEAISDAHRIPVAVCSTELGSGIRAISKPEGATFHEIQLILPNYADQLRSSFV